jgi:hypothetical protein
MREYLHDEFAFPKPGKRKNAYSILYPEERRYDGSCVEECPEQGAIYPYTSTLPVPIKSTAWAGDPLSSQTPFPEPEQPRHLPLGQQAPYPQANPMGLIPRVR